jgi:hypothetical protein
MTADALTTLVAEAAEGVRLRFSMSGMTGCSRGVEEAVPTMTKRDKFDET